MGDPGWRYIAQRLTGDGAGEFIDLDVPLQGASILDTVSGHNGLSATISPEISRLQGPDGNPIFDEWGTALWAESGGEIRGGGILTHSALAGPSWALECTGYTGYLVDLPFVGAGTFFVEYDPLDVVRYIWDHAQSKVGGNLGLQVSPLLTGLKFGTAMDQAEFDTEAGLTSLESSTLS